MMLFFRSLVFVLIGWGGLFAVPLSPETVHRYASDLLFFLGSSDTTITETQFQSLIAKDSEAVGMLYKKIYENRVERDKLQNYLSKQNGEVVREGYVFIKSFEIRAAVIELFLELGDGALEVLLESIHSARQEIVLGVIKALDQFQDSRVSLIMADVLEIDKWGRSKFSSLVRWNAVKNLRKYMDQELTRILLTRALKDRDALVRQNAQIVIGEAGERYLEFMETSYLSAYDFEIKLVDEEFEAAKSKGALKQFERDALSLSPLCVLLENIAKYRPQMFGKIHLPDMLLEKRTMLRTFLGHHDVLPEAMRINLLDRVFQNPNDGVIVLDALKALRKEDGARYKTALGPCLDVKQDPAIIHLALQWCGVWGLEFYKKELELIVANSRQRQLQELARQFLETL